MRLSQSGLRTRRANQRNITPPITSFSYCYVLIVTALSLTLEKLALTYSPLELGSLLQCPAMRSNAGMTNRRGNVDLRSAQVSAFISTLAGCSCWPVTSLVGWWQLKICASANLSWFNDLAEQWFCQTNRKVSVSIFPVRVRKCVTEPSNAVKRTNGKQTGGRRLVLRASLRPAVSTLAWLGLFQSGFSNVLNSGEKSCYQMFGYYIVRRFIVRVSQF